MNEITAEGEPPILIVDDNETIRKLAKAQLDKLGFRSDTAENGQEALDKLAQNKYALVLMDVQMPVMDGIEVTKKIRQSESKNGQHTTIIALTGHCARVDCIVAGMDDFIGKPMNIATLKKTLSKWL